MTEAKCLAEIAGHVIIIIIIIIMIIIIMMMINLSLGLFRS